MRLRKSVLGHAALDALVVALARVAWARGATMRAERNLADAVGPAIVAAVVLCDEPVGDEIMYVLRAADFTPASVVTPAEPPAPPTAPPSAAVRVLAEPPPLLLSVPEAARLLGVTRDALDKRIQRGQIPGVVRTGRRVQIHRAKLLATLERRAR